MKILFTAAAIFVGCALPNIIAAQTPDSPVEKPAIASEETRKTDSSPTAEKIADPVTETPSTPKQEPSTALAETLKKKPPFGHVVNFSSDVPSAEPIAKPNSAKAASSGSEWEFGFAPYVFAAGISGTVGARGRTLDLDQNFGSVWDALDLGLMGAFEVKKGRIVSLTDFMWIKLSQERDTAGPLYSTAKLGVNLFVLDPEVGYRFVDNEHGSVDVLGGVRIWSVETNLNTTTGLLPGFDVSQRKTWAAPVVGLRGTVNVTPKFFLTGKFDIGGAGIGADLTTQLWGGAGYRVHKNVALVGGYRWLQVDYDDEEGFLFDTQMQGFMFGAKFSW